MGGTLEIAVNAYAVAIAGCGVVSAAGRGVAALERAVAENVSALTRRECQIGHARQEIVGGFVPAEISTELKEQDGKRGNSRAFLFAAEALREACENSGELFGKILPARRGFVLSTTKANIEGMEMLASGRECPALAMRQIQPGLLAADLAQHFQCNGPVQCVSVACISGLLALQQGAAFIRRGHADVVLVAGVDLISQFVLSGFNTLKSLDPDGCRPFDKSRLGLSLGEGAGAIILAKPELISGPRILLTGCGSSNDANHITGPSRDGAGLVLAIRRALGKAEVGPEKIDFISTHGTGTVYNDNMESLALRSVFGGNVPPFNSSKGMLGHTLGAAGVLESIICISAMHARLLPGTPRLLERDPTAPDSLLAKPLTAANLDAVLKLNSGFAGTNAALMLQKEAA